MIAIPVTEASEVGAARRQAVLLASPAGLDEAQQGRLALIVTELATNLVKHARGGQILLDADDAGLSVLALDTGDGMPSVAACMADGYSTAGTLGQGLGAVKRLADEVDVVSWHKLGSAIRARVANGSKPARPPAKGFGAVCIAMRGEDVSGDAWSTWQDAAGSTVFVVDGLGHGPEAARAAHEAVLQFQRSRQQPVADILQAVHQTLRPTRGGAVAVARWDAASRSVGFAGVGNIAGTLVAPDGKVRHMVSHNGTAGHNARKIATFEYPGASGLLIMHSDGLSARWSLDQYPGLMRAHPLLVAGVLYRDHARGRDDATAAVLSLGGAR